MTIASIVTNSNTPSPNDLRLTRVAGLSVIS
jgi:hypothetical protein